MFLFSYLDKMVKKLGLILVFIVFISIFFISFLFFNQIKDLGKGDGAGGAGNTKLAIGGGELGANEGSDAQKVQETGGFDSGGVGSAGSGGGTGGLTGSGAGNAADTSAGDQKIVDRGDKPLCLLARPGNLPNIGCEVNYIRTDSVSLKMLNDLDEDMSVNIVLNDCFTTAYGIVLSKGNSDFVFSCSVQEYFESDMTITYTIGQSNIPMIGFVKGFISKS